mgnify:CR=1 FL=1
MLNWLTIIRNEKTAKLISGGNGGTSYSDMSVQVIAINTPSFIGYNFGIDVNPFSNLKLNLNVFRNDIENLIDTRVIARKTNGQNVFSYYNVNEVYTQGLEFNANYKLNENLTISGGYQLLYAKDKEAESDFENGQVFARITPNSPSFQLKKDDYFIVSVDYSYAFLSKGWRSYSPSSIGRKSAVANRSETVLNIETILNGTVVVSVSKKKNGVIENTKQVIKLTSPAVFNLEFNY